MPIHHSSLFDLEVCKTTGHKTFVAEVSDLPRPVMSNVYPDSCDLGFGIRSAKTGKVEMFRIKSEQSNSDEVVQWELEPCNPKLRDTGLTVMLIND